MKAVGVPTLLAAQKLAASSTAIRRDIDVLRTELTTGRVTNLTTSLGAQIEDAFNLRGALGAVNFQKQSLSQAALVSTSAQRILTALGEGGAALAADAIAANGRSDENALAVLATEARDKIRNAFLSLNARAGGQSLFAGDATDRPALSDADVFLADIAAIYAAAASPAAFEADLDAYFNDPAGGFQSSVYIGGSGSAPSIEIAAGERIQVTLRADDQSVRDLLRGLATVAAAGAAPPSTLRDSALLSGAARVISGSDALVLRRAEIGIAEKRAAELAPLIEAEETALTQAFNALTSRDPLEAAARLQSLETQLNASLVIAARLSQLTLANFLR